jgi:hypothetical protein
MTRAFLNVPYSPRFNVILFLGPLVLITVFFPFFNLFHILYPVSIFGKSAWIVIPSVIIGFYYILISSHKGSAVTRIEFFLLCAILLSFVIIVIHNVLYDDISSFLDFRYIPTFIIFILFSFKLLKRPGLLLILAHAVIFQALLVSAARIINYYFFPSFLIASDLYGGSFLNFDGDSTRNLLLSSSISANQIVCGMFTLLSLFRNRLTSLSFFAFFVLQCFLTFGALNTGSRYPIVVSILLLSFSLFVRSFKFIDFMKFLFLLTLIFIFTNPADLFSFNYFTRFQEDSGGRDIKVQIFLMLITASAQYFLIGVPAQVTASTFIDSVSLSDNSYALVATVFGLPFALLFFGLIFFYLRDKLSDLLSILMLAYIIFGLAITNCILWEPWVYIAMTGFAAVCCFGHRLSFKYTE